jgi:hypothetical protein
VCCAALMRMNVEQRAHRIYRNHPRPRVWDDGPLQTRIECERYWSQNSFPHYRRNMRPPMVWGWFVNDISRHLQQFYALAA